MIAYSLLTIAGLMHPLTDDTTRMIDARRGQRLDVQAYNGNVTIRTSPRMSVQVESEDEMPEITSSGNVIRIDNSPGRRRSGSDDITLTIPSTMDISVNAINGDVTVEGTTGAIEVENVDGDVTVRGGTGVVSLQSVSGSLSLKGARGKVALNTVNGSIHASDINGSLTAETVNDEVTLRGIQSDDVTASSINGDLSYDGTITSSGRYHFSTHNGNCTVRIPPGTGALLDVSTYSGEFESDFPVTMSDRRGKRFNATLGSGGAKLSLESFSGSIHLVKTMAAR